MSRLRNRQVCRTASCLVAAFLLSFTLLRPISAGAATQWWDTSAAGAPGDGLQAGNGNWSTTGGGTNLRWSTASTGTALTNWVNGNDAIFQTSGTSLVTLNSAGMTVNSMTFNGTGYTIGPGAGSLSLIGTATITTNADATISAALGGTVGMTKAGGSILTLSGANSYTGVTTINAGTLKLDNNNTTTPRLVNTSGITVNSGGTLLLAQTAAVSTDRINNAAGVTISGGGTFATGGLSEGTRPTNSSATNGAAGMGALTLQTTSSVSRATIDFLTGANGSTLAFSSLVGGNGAFLDIKNWTGTPFTDNSATGNDRLLFGIDPGLTAAQLANVRFFDDSGAFIGGGEIIGYGNMFEMVAVPESSTWLAAALALGAIGFSQRKRVRDSYRFLSLSLLSSHF